MNGIINILKPAGMTSSAVINKLKWQLKLNKVGHLGTLDPDAVGVLPVCVGKATRLFDYFLNKNKTYRTIFVFGKSTNTLDSSGSIEKSSKNIPTVDEIEKILHKFVGKIEQLPPKFSAKNINGFKAYDLARNNENFTLPTKQVEIFDFKLLNQIDENKFLFEITCSAGTYVRSLCKDLAEMLNTVAYVGAIIRTKSGQFFIDESKVLNEVQLTDIVKIEKVLENAQKILVSAEFYDKIVNGVKVDIKSPKQSQNVVIFCKGELIGIADVLEGKVHLKSFLKD